MSLLNIPGAIGSAISSLTSQGHKKGGVHGGNAALNSITSNTSDAQPNGSAQSLFGTLLDSVEQVAGIQTPASTAVSGVKSTATGSNASLSPAAMIAAARSAIRKA
jgi:hypothetical protein